jgi:ubiquinone/menaquinone biosynthesis C-methylase UbiE
MSVLDVGSGVGGPARFLAATYGCQVTGVDLSEPFVDAARYLTGRTGQSGQVSFQTASALELPFDDGRFDVALLQHVAMNISDRARLYREIRRVLQSGGRFATFDVVLNSGETFSATGVYSAAQAEAGKIHAHRTDLKDATVNLAGRRDSWEQQISESNRTLHNIRKHIDQTLSPTLQTMTANLEDLIARRIELETVRWDRDQVQSLQTMKDKIEKGSKEEKGVANEWELLPSQALRKLCVEVEAVLKEWNWKGESNSIRKILTLSSTASLDFRTAKVSAQFCIPLSQ